MAEAGENSPHLDEREQRQAASRAPINSLVIHEIVRNQGEEEIERSNTGLAWSGLAAGLSMGFSFLMESAMAGVLPKTPWSHLISSLGYSVGFLITVIGQQQLFTETTLTALTPALTRHDAASIRGMLRVWGMVLSANIVGTILFGCMMAFLPVYSPATIASLHEIATAVVTKPFVTCLVQAGSAGWLIGLMVWLLPPSGGARPFIVIILTWAVALLGLPHIVAGSVEAAYAAATGIVPPIAYVTHFFVPTLIGNVIGGAVLVGLLNHAPIRERLTGDMPPK